MAPTSAFHFAYFGLALALVAALSGLADLPGAGRSILAGGAGFCFGIAFMWARFDVRVDAHGLTWAAPPRLTPEDLDAARRRAEAAEAASARYEPRDGG